MPPLHLSVRFAVSALSLWALLPSTLLAQATPKPNVVLIVVDDAAIGDYRVLREKGLMPHIEALAAAGYEFTTSFASGSVGSTSRISILTGQYAWNHKEKGADLFFGGPPRHDEARLLPNWLRPAGYRTCKIGRTIPGYGAGDLTATELQDIGQPLGGLPAGFYAGFPPATHVPPGWDCWEVLVEPYTWSVDKYKISFGGIKVDFAPVNDPVERLHRTDAVAWRADVFIRSAPAFGKPFFLELAPVAYNRELWPSPSIYNVCPDATHPLAWWFGGPYVGVSERPPARHFGTIWNATSGDGVAAAQAEFPFPMPPSFNEGDVSDKPRWVQLLPAMTPQDVDCTMKRWWRRLEGLKAVDDMVGYVVKALSETNQLANTYIVLTSDNGMGDGQHRYNEKMTGYEESIRVPLIIRPPGGSAPVKIDRMVLGIDIAPTIAAIAGATPNVTVDGRSLLPLMQNAGIEWRKMGLLQHTLGRYESEEVQGPREYWGLRIAAPVPRLFLQYPTVLAGVKGEYYDLTADPYQLDNLFSLPERQAEINAIGPWLNAMKTCSGAVCRWLENNFNR